MSKNFFRSDKGKHAQKAVEMSCCLLPVQQLPEFPAPEGERRPMSFRRVLLNTCQEEFEGAAAAREVGDALSHLLYLRVMYIRHHCSV